MSIFNQAVDIVKKEGKGKIGTLQRSLNLSYAQALTIIKRMEKEGILNPQIGCQARTLGAVK